ncbi:endonuclease [Aureococcus anophagefferens]|nr:endonuclease [Aureococcus anophagefferens]
MGVPVVEAPGEAEASCVALVRHGACDFVVTEDMDALTFGAAKMVKNLFDVEGARAKEKRPAYEIDLAAALRELGPRGLGTMAAFVDFCILCGCDYLDHVPGVGPATAAKLLKSHASLERAVAAADEAAPAAPVAPLATSSTADDGADGDEAAPAPKAAKRVGRKVGGRPVAPRRLGLRAPLFFAPTVVAAGETVDAPPPDYAALRAFLVDGHEFNGDRVDKMVARLRKCREAKPQKRIDDFFSKSPAKGPAQSPARSPAAKPEPAAKREPDGAAAEPDGGDDIGLDAYVDARQERRGAPPAAAPAPAPPAAKLEPGARSAFFSGELRDISASASKKRKSPAKRPKPAASAEVALRSSPGETPRRDAEQEEEEGGLHCLPGPRPPDRDQGRIT